MSSGSLDAVFHRLVEVWRSDASVTVSGADDEDDPRMMTIFTRLQKASASCQTHSANIANAQCCCKWPSFYMLLRPLFNADWIVEVRVFTLQSRESYILRSTFSVFRCPTHAFFLRLALAGSIWFYLVLSGNVLLRLTTSQEEFKIKLHVLSYWDTIASSYAAFLWYWLESEFGVVHGS